MRGHGLVLHREMARVQRDAPKRWKRPRQGGVPRLPSAHPPDRRGAPRGPDNTGFAGAGDHDNFQDLATYALSARTCCGLRGPAVRPGGPGRPRVAPADTYGDLQGAVHA